MSKKRSFDVGEGGQKGGLGSSIIRREDERFLTGKGMYVSDIQMPGMLHAVFLRSPHAHARIKSIRKPAGFEDRVFVAADMADLKPIRSSPNFPNFKHSIFPVLAVDKVCFVGDPIALALANTPAEAEDLAGQIEVDYEVLEPSSIQEALPGALPA